MNKKQFTDFMYEEFPTVFENPFSREMLENILDYAETFGSESEQYNFLVKMIPQVTEAELRKVNL